MDGDAKGPSPRRKRRDVRRRHRLLRYTRVTGWAVPVLGQHTREILAELGYDDAAITALADGGAVTTFDIPVRNQ